MDIRDIKEKVPMIEDGSGLNRMFDLQKELVEDYIKIEGMPEYPISLNSKADQLLVKDFIGRIIEELAEAQESYSQMLILADDNKNEELIPHLQNFNEEISDSFHFLLETLLYINISDEDICNYYEVLLKKANMYDIFWYGGKDILKTIFAFARQTNALACLYGGTFKIGYHVIRDNDLKDEFLRGGRIISLDNLCQIKQMMWDVAYHLNISRNFLKNKPWKQTQMTTDVKRFHVSIMEAWLAFFCLLDFVGMTPDSLFTIYFKKNLINRFRIESAY